MAQQRTMLVAQSVAHIFSVPVAFEFQTRKVRWSLISGPHRRECDGKDLGALLQPAKGRETARRLANPWTMRDEFFHLRRGDDGALVDFLNRWGWWRSWEQFHKEGAESAASIWELYDLFRGAVTSAPKGWLADPRNDFFTLGVQPRAGVPPYVLSVSGCELAIRATITIDLLNGAKFRICAREDCRTPYLVESGHPRKFCKQYCGHVVSQRKKRRAEKRSKGANDGKD